jgi:protein TonB
MMRFYISFSILIIFFTLNKTNAQTTNRDSSNSKIIYSETMPEFPGGLDELMKFIKSNIQYETNKDKRRGVGTVQVKFIIENDGSINDYIVIVSPLTDYYNQEAIRIVKKMPKWTPGKQNGQPVKVLFTLPIRF